MNHTRLALFLITWLCPLQNLSAGGEIAGCPLFPADNVWNATADNLPVHPRSSDYIESIGASAPVHPDFGSGIWPPETGGPIGIPFALASDATPRVAVSFGFDAESDPGPYPIPADAPIEGGPNSQGDRHILIVDSDNCLLYELFHTFPQQDGSWQAGSGAIFDLRSNALRPQGWTSADAAGLPILPGLVRYDEIAAGEITHALRFTAPQTQRAFVWPARHFASNLTSPVFPPMGQRFRLRSDFDIERFHPYVQVILKALKTHGMILADNGSPWFVSGVPDERWDNDVLRQLRDLQGSDFEAVDTSSLRVDADSGRTSSGRRTLYFPQVGIGSSSEVSFQTTMTWLNGGEPATVRVEFFDAEGQPWPVPLDSEGTVSDLEFQLGHGASHTIKTTIQEGLEVGYTRFYAPSQVEALAVFSGSDGPSQTVLYEAGVPAEATRSEFTIAVDTLGQRGTGLVLVHPAADGEDSAAQVTLRLYDESFQQVAETTLELLPGEHMARFLFEFFSESANLDQVREMRGSLTVESTHPLAALALRQNDDPSRSFPDEVPTLTSIPVLPIRPGQ